MKHLKLLSLLALFAFNASAQNVGIGTPTPSDQLHTTGTVRFENYKGANTRIVQMDASGRLVTTAAGAVFSNTTAQAIPDNGCASGTGISSPITITGQSAAVSSSKITVRVNITHPYVGDLKIYLFTSATPVVLCLADNNGGDGDNFANTVFTDLAATSITAGVAPFTGQYKPNGGAAGCNITATAIGSFATFGFGSIVPNGTWTLRVLDNSGTDVGTLNNWSISFSGPESITTADENNYIPKFSAGNLVASSIYQPAGSTNIGIGTTNPLAPLSFPSSTGNKISLWGNATGPHYGIGIGGGALQLYADGSNSDILFGYGSSSSFTEKMRVKGNGNVGIGNTNPTASLDVVRGTGTDGTARFTGTQYASHFNYFTDEQTFIRGGKSTSEVIINDLGSGNVRIAQAGGNVGIGTGSPGYKLTVRKTGIGISQEDETGTHAVGFLAASSGGWLQTHTVSPLYMGAGNPNSPHLQIETNGNVGIGTVGVPTEKLEVAGQIKLTGGAPGIGKVLTSDAAGKGSWQIPAAANTGFHASASGVVSSDNPPLLVPYFDNVSTQDFDDGSRFFNGSSSFLAPAGGVYNFDFAVFCGHAVVFGGTVSNGGSITVTLRKNGTVIKTVTNSVVAGYPVNQTISGSASVKLIFNDTITVYIENDTDIAKDIISGNGAQSYFSGHRVY